MIFDFLHSNDIQYERVDHPPVYTCEEAKFLVPPMQGAETKNLFLRDDKGRRHYLLVIPAEKKIDLKQLGISLNIKGIGFASAERLKKYLGVEPGSVTFLAVVNDQEHAVEVIIDEELWQSEALRCHPLVNTSTLSVPKESVQKFLDITGHPARILSIPDKAQNGDAEGFFGLK